MGHEATLYLDKKAVKGVRYKNMVFSLLSHQIILYGICFAVVVLPASKALLEIGMASIIFVWLARKIILREAVLIPRLLLITMGLFLAIDLLSISVVPAENQWVALRGLVKWIKFSLLFFAVYETVQDETSRRRIITAFLVSACIVVLNGIYQMFHGTDLIRHYTVDVPGRLIRMRSTFGSPNGLAGYLVVALPLAFDRWLSQKKWSRQCVFPLVATALIFTGLISTLSRAAFFSIILVLLSWLVLKKKITLLPLLVVCLIGLASVPMLRENFVESLHKKDITINERARFWGATLKMIQDRPWFGHGVNQYFRVFPKYIPDDEKYRGYAHNCYLQMASEIGLVGLFLFLIPFMVYWPRALMVNGALGIAIGSFLVHSAFDTHFYAMQLSALFWIFWGMLASQTLNRYSLPGSRSLSGG